MDDVARFRTILDEKMGALLDTNWRTVMESVENPNSGPVFCGFYHDPVGDNDPVITQYCRFVIITDHRISIARILGFLTSVCPRDVPMMRLRRLID